MQLASSLAFPEPLLAAMWQLSENSRLGFRLAGNTLHQGFGAGKYLIGIGDTASVVQYAWLESLKAQQQNKEVNTVYNETSGLRPDTASDPNSAQNLQTARQNVAHVYENTNGNGFQSSDQLSGREKSAIKNGDPTATASMSSSQQAVAAAHQDRTDPTHGATHIYLYDLSPNSTQRVPAWVRNGNPTTVQGPFINAAGGGDVRAGSLVLILTIKDQR